MLLLASPVLKFAVVPGLGLQSQVDFEEFEFRSSKHYKPSPNDQGKKRTKKKDNIDN